SDPPVRPTLSGASAQADTHICAGTVETSPPPPQPGSSASARIAVDMPPPNADRPFISIFLQGESLRQVQSFRLSNVRPAAPRTSVPVGRVDISVSPAREDIDHVVHAGECGRVRHCPPGRRSDGGPPAPCRTVPDFLVDVPIAASLIQLQ